MRPRHVCQGLAFALLLATPVAAAQDDWLPPRVVDGLAQQLAERLEAIGPRPASREKALAGLRQGVIRWRVAIETWGERGVLERVPKFPEVALPTSGQRHLDAMAGYQMCIVVLMKQYVDAPDRETRVVGALGLSGVTTVIAFLRPPFLAQGGTTPQVEAFLTGEAMGKAVAGIQQSQRLFEHVQSGCSPIVAELLTALG